MKNNITIEEERIRAEDYIDFLNCKRKCDSFLRKPWNEKV